jgi:hypothetical protein
VGTGALTINTLGGGNTALGYETLNNNNGGFANYNNAIGAFALNSNTLGGGNNALGGLSLKNSTTGSNNTAVGDAAGILITTGNDNVAIGADALYPLVFGFLTGDNNIAIGYLAGQNLNGSESNTIDIGNYGLNGQSGVINIGTAGTHTVANIAGITGNGVTGAAVYVSSTGQLGILSSSERFKTDIASMHLDLAKVLELRPVTFHYKSEPAGTLQYGLIAEEVAKVFPDLIVRDSKGAIQSVRYDELSSILLKELQTQQAAMTHQQKQLEAQEAQVKELNEKFAALEKHNRELGDAILRLTKDAPAQRP